MSATALDRLVEAFAAADITEDTIAGLQDEMRGASVEEQYAILTALRNAGTLTLTLTLLTLTLTLTLT